MVTPEPPLSVSVHCPDRINAVPGICAPFALQNISVWHDNVGSSDWSEHYSARRIGWIGMKANWSNTGDYFASPNAWDLRRKSDRMTVISWFVALCTVIRVCLARRRWHQMSSDTQWQQTLSEDLRRPSIKIWNHFVLQKWKNVLKKMRHKKPTMRFNSKHTQIEAFIWDFTGRKTEKLLCLSSLTQETGHSSVQMIQKAVIPHLQINKRQFKTSFSFRVSFRASLP